MTESNIFLCYNERRTHPRDKERVKAKDSLKIGNIPVCLFNPVESADIQLVFTVQCGFNIRFEYRTREPVHTSVLYFLSRQRSWIVYPSRRRTIGGSGICLRVISTSYF